MSTMGKSLQENVLTLLVHSEQHGAYISKMVTASLFEGDYRLIADRALIFWSRYNKPPHEHMPDLLDDILGDDKNRRRPIMVNILRLMHELAPKINTVFAIDSLQSFVRMQTIKGTIIRSAERLHQKQEFAIEEVEGLLEDLLHQRTQTFDLGTRLGDLRELFDDADDELEFRTGIPILDRHHIVPQRDTLWVFVAASGRGKTWHLLDLGKHAILHGKKVLFISLEMGVKQLMQRAVQNAYRLAKREEQLEVRLKGLKLDKDGKFMDFEPRLARADFALRGADFRKRVAPLLKNSIMGQKSLDRMFVKHFPEGTLTLGGLTAYLDKLRAVEKFEPDLLILDYAAKMKIDTKDFRLALGRTFEQLHGLAVERHIAIGTAQQTNREGAGAQRVTEMHIGEDYSVMQAADFLLTLTRSDSEARHGLARIHVEKARDEQNGFNILIEQNYAHGMFCGRSCLEPKDYDPKKLEEPR